ncbi:type I-E CRISPR-associated protein Cse2/CasB [Rhodococcus erythropolis]
MTTVSPAQDAAAPAQRSAGTSRLDSYRTFTNTVTQICRRDPGARSALRSGVRKDLDAAPRMHQVIAHLVPPHAGEDTQRAYYAVAAMIAEQTRRQGTTPPPEEADDNAVLEPADTSPTARATAAEDGAATTPEYGMSLGASFALAVLAGPGSQRRMRRSTAESRLNLLCKQGVNGLHRHLPASTRYLRSLDAPVDWARLLQDLADWRRHSARITRRWLQDYYRRCQEADRRAADHKDQQEQADADD